MDVATVAAVVGVGIAAIGIGVTIIVLLVRGSYALGRNTAQVENLDTAVEVVRNEVKEARAEARQDNQQLRAETRQDNQQLREEIREARAEARQDNHNCGRIWSPGLRNWRKPSTLCGSKSSRVIKCWPRWRTTPTMPTGEPCSLCLRPPAGRKQIPCQTASL
jgi:hypothetical protein